MNPGPGKFLPVPGRPFRIFTIFLFPLVLFVSDLRANEVCTGGDWNVCAVTESQGRNVRISIRNDCTFPITVTMNAQIDGMNSDQRLPVTLSVGSGDTIPFLNLAASAEKWTWKYNYNFVAGLVDALHDPDSIYLLPYHSGLSFPVLQGYNGKFSHHGELAYAVDFDMPEGTDVLAMRDGTVVGTRDSLTGNGITPDYMSRSNFVFVLHTDGTIATYDHLKQYSILVEAGDHVKAGDRIALSGNVGFSTKPHLHVMVFRALDGNTRQSFPVNFFCANTDGCEVRTGRQLMAR